MKNIITGFILALVLSAGLAFGHDACMTAEGPAVQGYIGAAIPAVLILIGAALGYAAALFERA